MITTRQEMLDNAVTTAELSYMRMEDGNAELYAEVFKKNTSIENLILSRCAITDDEFSILGLALIERNRELFILNLDYNYLTAASMPILKKLIEKQLVIHLCLYENSIMTERECLLTFKNLATEHHMAVYNTNPLIRENKYPDIFGCNGEQPHVDTLKVTTTPTNDSEKILDEVKEAPPRFIK